MKKGQLQKAKPDIISFFNASDTHVFSYSLLNRVLNINRYHWKLSASIYLKKFVEFLLNEIKFEEIILEFPHVKIKRYLWNKPSIFEITLSLYPKAYLSHYSAVFLHNLSEQIPKTIYLNLEQTIKPRQKERLEQGRINTAFKNKQRMSNNVATYKEYKLCVLNGKYTDNLGVVEISGMQKEKLFVTNLERTLIDIVVRPAYSGGVFEVLNAYRLASDKISINKLAATLKQLDYIYPYHQAIGFYLEKAGVYRAEQINFFKNKFKTVYDFYLTHGMKEMAYSENWHLYYPKGM